MINIKNIDGSLLYAAPVTKDAVFHHELMSSEYIELVFNEVTVIDIPIGAYVEYNGSRYTVTNPVTPDIIDGGYKYSIQFKADWMRWEGITYFYINEFSQKNETSWSMTATPDLFLQMIVENISRATGKIYTFSYDSSLTATKDLQFNNTTVLEALSMVADAFETEWWIEGDVIHLSRCEHGDALALTYGQNIGVPSVQRSSEYATRIYAFGSTRNITQDYQNSGTTNALVEKRLTLPAGKYPNGYKDIKPNLSPEEIIEKTVIFDDIYPSSDFAISDVRVKVSVDSTTEVGKDENGNPIYASMPVYFFKIAGIAFSEDLIIEGLTLKVHFSTGHLQGREFELAYHKDTSEYEIIVNQDGAIKLPNETLLPQDNDVVVLFNIVMPDEYVTSAENRLEAALDDYIEKKLLSDNNTYSFKSNPVTFAENNTSVNVGRKITLNHGTGILQSRILSIEYPLEYPSKVDISVGESIPQGKISSVETEVVNASSTIEIIQAYNNVAQTVQNLYARTQNQITEGLAKLANMWILDQSKDTTPNKTNPDVWFVRSPYDVVGLKGISAYGLGSTSGGGASGSLGELVNVGQWADEVPTADRVMVQLAGATHWSAKPLADLVGLDTAALAQYLTANSYLKASDISSYLTWANLSGKPTVYPTSWANIADKPTVYPTTWTSVTGRPTKLSDLTDDVVAGNYLPKPTWDAVFEVVTVDGTPALKVKYDILGLKGITAYADGSLSGGFSGALVDLVDVAVTNLASGDILKYNGTHFVNVPVSSIAGASSWDQITGKPEYYPTRWADVSGAPTSLPASDVYPWAKAASKPTYTAAEVGAVALNGGGDVSGSINASAYLTANTLRSEAALYPTISFVKTNDNSESLLIVAGNNLYYRPVASDATNRLVYHSGNFNPSSKLDKSVWDEAFELKTVNGVRVISAKLDFLSVAGISAYATGPSSGGGGGGLDYDLLKQALTGAITPDGYPFTISASFLGAIGNTYLPLSGGTLTNTGNSAPLIITGSSLQACTKYMMNGSTVSGYFGVVAQGLNGAFMQYANGTISPSLIINNDAAPRFINTAGTQFALYHSGNFNPDRKFGLSDIISDLNNAPLNAVFSTNGTPANAPLENAYFQGFTFAMDNNPGFKRQWAFKDKKIWFRNLHAGSWSAWTDVIPLDNYLPLSGGSITGGLGVSGYLTAGSLKINETGSVYPQILFTGNNGNSSLLFVNAISRELVFRPADGVANDGIVYHSKNLTKLSQLTNDVVPSWAMATTNHYLPYDDTRNTNYAPYNSNIPKGLTTVHLKTPGIDGLTDGSTFHSSIYITPWIDASGGPAHNIAFTDSGNMWMRHGTTSWSEWVKVYHSGNFNPDNYLPLSGGKMITGDFQFKDGVAVRDAAGRSVVGLLDVAGDGVCVAVGNSAKKTRIVTPNDTPVYRNDGKGAYRIYDSSNSNLSTVDWSANNLNAAANLDVAGQAYVSGWLRSRGNVGWYSQDYGGGIYMTDSTWVRVYGSKGLMIDTGTSHINMGQLQIACSAEASIGFRSASNGNWCLGKGVSSIGSGFGLYNAATNRVAFQIASATDAASFASSITAAGTIVSMSTVESRGNNSTGILPQMLWHIPGVTYARIRMASNGTLHVINGASEAYHSLYAQSFVAAGNVTAADTVTATKLVIGGITIDVYNGALRVNGNLVATGGVTSLATA